MRYYIFDFKIQYFIAKRMFYANLDLIMNNCKIYEDNLTWFKKTFSWLRKRILTLKHYFIDYMYNIVFISIILFYCSTRQYICIRFLTRNQKSDHEVVTQCHGTLCTGGVSWRFRRALLLTWQFANARPYGRPTRPRISLHYFGYADSSCSDASSVTAALWRMSSRHCLSSIYYCAW